MDERPNERKATGRIVMVGSGMKRRSIFEALGRGQGFRREERNTIMRTVLLWIAVGGIVTIGSSNATAGDARSLEAGIVVSESTTNTAVVEKIDHRTRTVTIKGPRGGIAVLTVNKDEKIFDEVQKGDRVTLSYHGLLRLRLERSEGSPASTESSLLKTVPAGQKTKIISVETEEGMVTIESLDAPARTITVRNAKGDLKTHKIGEQVTDFDMLEVGHQIYYSYTQAVMLEVTKP